MADKLRSNMDAAEYKHVVLGLIFLKFISDKFNAKYEDLKARQKTDFTDPEERDEYVAENVFWVPKGARWQDIQDRATTAEIGQIVDDAMRAIEAENPTLEGVLPKNYARADLDKRLLGEVINLVGKVELVAKEAHHQGNDLLGRTYEYFIGQFAAAEGKRGGQFYTPARVVELLVRMIKPYKGRVYDPCCGSGGMFVQSEKFVEAHGGGRDDLSVYGQESNPQTWRLAKMNLAIRGITANLGPRAADSFHDDLHKDLKADFILANPPFNISDWGGERRRSDVRWKFGAPPVSNANFAWVQHMVHHLAPHGLAGFILANGSLSSNQSGEGEIRAEIIVTISWTASSRCPANFSTRRRFPSACGFLRATNRTAFCATSNSATGVAKPCSSTRGRLATWKRAPCGRCPARPRSKKAKEATLGRSLRPITHGVRAGMTMRTCLASARR